MNCPNCGRNNPPGARFCTNCRFPLPEEPKRFRKLWAVIGLEAVLLVFLAGVFWYVGKNMTSPQAVLEKYWEALSEDDWASVYESCDIPSSKLLTKQLLVNAARHQPLVTSWEETESRKEDGNWYFTVEYEDQSEEQQTKETVLIPTEKKWGLFQKWKVSSGDLLVKGVTLYLPPGSSVSLNGEEIAMEEAEEDSGTVALELPWLFAGDYQLQVSKAGMETYRTNLSLESSDAGFQYEVMMRPARKLEQELVEKSGAAIQRILQSALTGKDFSTVSDLFSAQAIESGQAEEDYNEIKDVRSDGKREGVTFFEIYGLEGQISLEQTSEDGALTMEMEGSAKKRYVLEFLGRLNQEISEGTIQLNFDYVKEDGEWRLNEMPITEENIRSI